MLPHPHYKSTIYSFNDIYYLLPDHRTAANGIRLFQSYEDAMRARMKRDGLERDGADWARARLQHNPAPILLRLGWEPAEMCYTKVLHG